ncbi:MAG: 5-formyltetrahydrofolate cyclo-ligase [Methanomicrobiales archaeon]|nr:5-formyltetrahydrofolate cyclo-ligase [Methanomicrobiales archaeon]
MITKKDQRTNAKQRRLQMSIGDIKERSAWITMHALSILESYNTILIYSSKFPEVDTHNLLERLISQGKNVIVPIIERETHTLRLSYLRDTSVLVTSTFKVPEPIGNEIPANPKDIETAVIPMIAFDFRGDRLGYGAGYYDRFLNSNPHVVKIGLAFFSQKEEKILTEPDDIHMDYVITECGIIPCKAIRKWVM